MGTTDNRDEGEYADDTPTTGPLTDDEKELMRSTELDVSGLDPILFQVESRAQTGIGSVFAQPTQPNA